MHILSKAALVAGLGMLAACATATPFQAAESPGDVGYSSTQVTSTIYRVNYQGDSLTDREEVETALLYRAAQIAQENGMPYFLILNADTDRDIRVRSFTSFDSRARLGGRWFGRFHYYRRPIGGFGTTDVSVSERFEAMALIQLYAEEPNARGAVFQTDQVLENLGPLVFS